MSRENDLLQLARDRLTTEIARCETAQAAFDAEDEKPMGVALELADALLALAQSSALVRQMERLVDAVQDAHG